MIQKVKILHSNLVVTFNNFSKSAPPLSSLYQLSENPGSTEEQYSTYCAGTKREKSFKTRIINLVGDHVSDNILKTS